MKCPRCKRPDIAVIARLHYHPTVFGNRSRYLKYGLTSVLRCAACRHEWRTKSPKHDALPDADYAHRCCSGLTDNDLRVARERAGLLS